MANLVIEEAVSRGRPVTNLGLQKILYFIQGRYLLENNAPLMAGYFEAWQYGPVHPLIYDSFKDRGSSPLSEGASKRDLLTGKREAVETPRDALLARWIRDAAAPYIQLTPGRLVDLSHARGSPWDVLTGQAGGVRKFGLRITHDMITDRFKFHKVAVDRFPRVGEPDEESPPN